MIANIGDVQLELTQQFLIVKGGNATVLIVRSTWCQTWIINMKMLGPPKYCPHINLSSF